MKTTYWIAGILVAGFGAGVVGMASAHQGGPERMSFETLDADGDGKLTQAEMDAQKAAEFTKTDTNGDEMLSAEEMLARANIKAGDRMANRIKFMIERIDANKDGMLSMSEMQDMPRGKDMFKRLDTDGDGAISAEEYAARKGGRWMGHKGPRMGHKGPWMGQQTGPASE